MQAPERGPLAFYRLLPRSFLRFFVASLLGLAVDICIAWTLTTAVGLSLIASVALSIGLASVLMYFVHEFWTFADLGGQASATRLTGTVISALAALGVRSLCLFVTSTWLGLGGRWTLLQIVAATGLSFLTNYVLVRRILGGKVAPPPVRQDAALPPPSRIQS